MREFKDAITSSGDDDKPARLAEAAKTEQAPSRNAA
jgi:hypothetical protein